MITRGHFIGQIIDELSDISNQIKTRTKIGLTDINHYSEDFFKDILNVVFDYDLVNLNDERSNEAGLDLGDSLKKVAFQITSTKTSHKINDTLRKSISQLKDFPNIYVLILQEKQTTYSLDVELLAQVNFSQKNILDINDIISKIVHLQIDKLQELHKLINQNAARVKIELEIPDDNGIYKTDIKNYIEKIPNESFLGLTSYFNFHKNLGHEGITEAKTMENFRNFISKLKKLPRITRQFYAFLLTRCESGEYTLTINDDYLQRICTYPDRKGELRLLMDSELCWFYEPNQHFESGEWIMKSSDYFLLEFMEYIESNSLGSRLEKIIVDLDFTPFETIS